MNRSSLAVSAGVEIARKSDLRFFVDMDSRFNAYIHSHSVAGGQRYWW